MANSSKHWYIIRNYKFQWQFLLNTVLCLQIPLADPSEQCYVITGSSGKSFSNTDSTFPVACPFEYCYIQVPVEGPSEH